MPPKASLNVSLTPELMIYVGALVTRGRYRTASEVIRAGLRLLQRDEFSHAEKMKDGGTEEKDGGTQEIVYRTAQPMLDDKP